VPMLAQEGMSEFFPITRIMILPEKYGGMAFRPSAISVAARVKKPVPVHGTGCCGLDSMQGCGRLQGDFERPIPFPWLLCSQAFIYIGSARAWNTTSRAKKYEACRSGADSVAKT
ncbi:hypothetical protein, partial [Paenibacillus dendritiformis]|uniref:hypothetical protein n=1 Tax=Paenibacillus dendritiformis TaxID=130049 RepID=UPI001C26B720